MNLSDIITQNDDGARLNDALNFLDELSGDQGDPEKTPAPKPSKPPKLEDEKPLEGELSPAKDLVKVNKLKPQDDRAPAVADEPTLETEPTEPSLGYRVMGTAKAVLGDILTGVRESPLQALGGAIDGVNEFIDMGDIAQEAMPLPGFSLSEGVLSAEEATAAMKARQQSGEEALIPTTAEATSVTGGLIRGASQFLMGFRLGRPIFGTSAVGNISRGVFGDIVAFDGHEERLSDLVQSQPKLRNPVTEYLASDPKDSEAEGRFKNAVEGLIPSTLVGGLVSGLKAVRSARQLKTATGAPTYTETADALEDTVRRTGVMPTSQSDDAFKILGDSSDESPLVIRAGEKLKKSTKATELPVPDDVAAKGVANAARVGDSDVYINFAKINAPDDVQAVIRDMADAFKGDVEAARRGVRSNKTTVAAAGDKYDQVWTQLLERKTGQLTMNAEEQFALRRLWTASGEKLLQVAQAATSNPTIENALAFRKMMSLHHMIQNEAVGIRTETARALQQWNIPVGVGGRQKVDAIRNILMQHGGTDVNLDLAKKFAGLAEEVAADPGKMAKVSKVVEKVAGARSLKAISEAWVGLGLLSGPKTHIRNLISNTGMMVSAVAERAIASRALGMLDEGTAIEIGEAAAMVDGYFSHLKQAWLDARSTFKTGDIKGGLTQLDIPPEMAMRSLDPDTLFGKTMRALSYPTNIIFKALKASDQFYQTMNYGGEIHALAKRAAIQGVRNGTLDAQKAPDFIAEFISNPPKEAVDSANAAAAYRTFTSEPGKWTRSALRVRNEYPGLRFIIPFVNVTSNIFRTSIEHSPLAPRLTKYKEAIAKGGAEATLARTRMAMGSAVIATMTDLVMSGKITGSGPPQGSPEYDALTRTGWKPYSIKIGKQWYSYRGIEPFSTVMGIGADIGDYIRYSDDTPETIEDIKDLVAIGSFSMFDQILDRSFMRGTSEFLGAAIDPRANAPKWFDALASSFVPRGLTEVRQQMDPVVRDARGLVDAFANRIPYWSMTVPEKRDAWGRAESTESGQTIWSKAYDTLSPFRSKPIEVQPIDRELLKQGFDIGDSQRSMTIDSQRLSLANRPDVFNRFLELRGQTNPSDLDIPKKEQAKLIKKYGDADMLTVLNGIVTGDHPLAKKYIAGSDGQDGGKHKLLRQVVADFGRAARLELKGEFPELTGLADDSALEKAERAQRGEKMFEELLPQ